MMKRVLVQLRLNQAITVGIAVWLLAAGYGAATLIHELPGRLQAGSLAEDAQRNSAWSPIYGFANACQTKIAPSAGVLLIDPTGADMGVQASQRTGPEAFGFPADLDWPNQAAFAYVLYPRPVSALGHVPVNLTAAAGSAQYIAIWRQASFRSSAALAAASQADAAVAASGGTLVCTYTSSNGDRGDLYRMTTAALAPIATASPPWWNGKAAAYIAVVLGLLSLWTIGFVLLRLISPMLPGGFAAAASLPLGCLSISLELLAFSVLRIPWSAPLLATPWVLAGTLLGFRDGRAAIHAVRQASVRSFTESWWRLTLGERLALAGLIGVALVLLIGAPQGLPFSDGFNLYYFKSQAFFSGGTVIPFYQAAGTMPYTFPAHPPLVSLAVTWLYLFIGHVDEHTTLLLWPALFISLIGVLYALARTRLSRAHALWFVFAASLVGYQLAMSALNASFADLPLAVFLALGCGTLCLWAAADGRPIRYLVLAGVFLSGAALTKEEGLVAALLTLLAIPLLLGRGQPYLAWARLKPIAIATAVFVVVAGPWLLLRSEYHLQELTVYGGSVSVLLHRLPAAASGLAVRAALPLAPTVALLLIAGFARPWRELRKLNGGFWFLVAVVVMQLAVDAVGIAAAPVEVHHQVAIAASRLISQVVPLTFLASLEIGLFIAAPFRLPVTRVEAPQQQSPVAARL